jgi:hypothetical protein
MIDAILRQKTGRRCGRRRDAIDGPDPKAVTRPEKQAHVGLTQAVCPEQLTVMETGAASREARTYHRDRRSHGRMPLDLLDVTGHSVRES